MDHKLLKLEIFQDLKGQKRRATWIALSQIRHFTKHTGQCSFYQGQMSEDWDISPKIFRAAIQLLLKEKLIKQVRPYSRKENLPAVYKSTRPVSLRDIPCVPEDHNLCPPGPKPVSPRDRVNNYVNNYKPQDDDFGQSSPVDGKEVPRVRPIDREQEEIRNKLLNNNQL